MDFNGEVTKALREGETRKLSMFYDFNGIVGAAAVAQFPNPLIVPYWGELEVRGLSATMCSGPAGVLTNNTTLFINFLLNGDTWLFMGDSTIYQNGIPLQLVAGKTGNIALVGGQGNFPLILKPGDKLTPAVTYASSVTTPTARSPLYLALDCRLSKLVPQS